MIECSYKIILFIAKNYYLLSLINGKTLIKKQEEKFVSGKNKQKVGKIVESAFNWILIKEIESLKKEDHKSFYHDLNSVFACKE